MADLIIKGVEMPKGETDYVELQIWGDGTVYKRRGLAGKLEQIGIAVPLPEGHGRLIDADALAESVQYAIGTKGGETFIIDLIDEAETIVPAEGGTDDVRCL